ncbi:MAG: nucleotidyltransferase domain-containing protein [Nanoarchaeota archaeon]
MVYTEIKKINGKKYYYRVLSVRTGKKVSKKRKYLGIDLNKEDLSTKEMVADKELVANTVSKEIERIKNKIKNILKKNKVKRAGIFGSYARGEQKDNSDIDILVEIDDKEMSLLKFINFKNKLEEILKSKVDLVEYKLVRPEIKENIFSEEIRII